SSPSRGPEYGRYPMSWMTPSGGAGWSDGLDMAGPSLAEDVLDVVVARLEAHQAELQVSGDVADHVVDPVIDGLDLDQPATRPGVQPAAARAFPIRSWASPGPATSTSKRPVAWVNSDVAQDRSRCPASSTTTWSQIRSSSPTRCEVTRTAMPNSLPILRISSRMSSRAAGSRPLVGS